MEKDINSKTKQNYEDDIFSYSPYREESDFVFNKYSIKDFLKGILEENKEDYLLKQFDQAEPLAIDLLCKMFEIDYNKRISIEDCLKHPYFEGVFEEKDLVISKDKYDWEKLEKILSKNDKSEYIRYFNEIAQYFKDKEDIL